MFFVRWSHNNSGFFFFSFDYTDPNKPHIIGQRKVIIKNADGTTKIIQQNIPAPQPKSVAVQAASSSTSTASNSSTGTDSGIASSPNNGGGAQKVQIIRGPDGKVSVRGLNPGQQLIQMSDGKLHVLTTNQSGGHTKTVLKSNAPGTPKSVMTTTPNKSIVIPQQQRQQASLVTATLPKSPVVIRQQLPKASTVVAKATPKQQNSQRVSFICVTFASTEITNALQIFRLLSVPVRWYLLLRRS